MADYKAMAERWFGEVLSEGKVDVMTSSHGTTSSTTRSPARAPTYRA